MGEIRNIGRNFVIYEREYNHLLILMSETPFKNVSVFVTQKIIMAYYRRIDKSRLDAGKIAREPIPRRLKNSDRGAGLKTIAVHTSLTASENQALEDVLRYHNFIDKNGKPEYSQFLACVIIKMWGDRDEIEETPIDPTPRKASGLDALNPENFGG
ncbi:MAG: hypothetical protein IKB70_07030 [Bacilli bacterium]|nr:hypothetical protein [Bacilli bacterium]